LTPLASFKMNPYFFGRIARELPLVERVEYLLGGMHKVHGRSGRNVKPQCEFAKS
jgi:hypothetical protein